MDKLLNIFVYSGTAGAISTILFEVIVDLYSQFDDSRIAITKRKFTLLAYEALMIFINALLFYKYGGTVTTAFLSFFLWYLSLAGYIDHKTKMVYSSYNVVALLMGIILLVYTWKQYDISGILSDGSLIIWFLFLIICKGLHLYGAGDFDVLLIETVYFCCIPGVRQPIGGTMLFVVLGALGLQFIIHYKEIDFVHLRLKNSVAFVPALFLSSLVNILII